MYVSRHRLLDVSFLFFWLFYASCSESVLDRAKQVAGLGSSGQGQSGLPSVPGSSVPDNNDPSGKGRPPEQDENQPGPEIEDKTITEGVNYKNLFDVKTDPSLAGRLNRTSSFSCTFDTEIDGQVGFSSECRSLAGLQFSSETGELNWNVSYEAHDNASDEGQYEFLFTVINDEIIYQKIVIVTVMNIERGFIVQLDQSFYPDGFNLMGRESCNGIDVDKDGNVYCAGYTHSYPKLVVEKSSRQELNTAFCAKFSPSGKLIWRTEIERVSLQGYDYSTLLQSVKVDQEGNVYCAGGYDPSPTFSFNLRSPMIAKLDPQGKILWKERSFSVGGPCRKINLDSQNNILCSNRYLFKMDQNRRVLWTRDFTINDRSSAGNYHYSYLCEDMAIDQSDNILCTGWVGSASGHYVQVMKINSNGEDIWRTKLDSKTFPKAFSFEGLTRLQGIALDSRGNIYAGGYTNAGIAQEKFRSDIDALVLKMNTQGEIEWVKQLGEDTLPEEANPFGDDRIYTVAVDLHNRVILGGETNGRIGEDGGGTDSLLIAYSSEGELEWIFQMGKDNLVKDAENNTADSCVDLAIGPDGSIYCSGFTGANLAAESTNPKETHDAFFFKISADGKMN